MSDLGAQYGQMRKLLLKLAGAIGSKHISCHVSTEHMWGYENYDSICRVVATASLFAGDTFLCDGQAQDCFAVCKVRGQKHFAWQSQNGPSTDEHWNLIAELLSSAGVIAGPDQLVASIEVPTEPAPPTTSKDGQYVVLRQSEIDFQWNIIGRYNTSEDALRACRIADRSHAEGNGDIGSRARVTYSIGHVDVHFREETGVLGDVTFLTYPHLTRYGNARLFHRTITAADAPPHDHSATPTAP